MRDYTLSTVDRLAQVIRDVDGNHDMGAGALAEQIIASDWHAEVIRAAKAEGWSEGFQDGQRQDAEGEDGPRFTNPYRGERR